MTTETSFARTRGAYPGAVRPCQDCPAEAVLLSEPAPNGARVVIVHEASCPWLAEYERQRAGE
jgi:hypothetical protein